MGVLCVMTVHFNGKMTSNNGGTQVSNPITYLVVKVAGQSGMVFSAAWFRSNAVQQRIFFGSACYVCLPCLRIWVNQKFHTIPEKCPPRVGPKGRRWARPLSPTFSTAPRKIWCPTWATSPSSTSRRRTSTTPPSWTWNSANCRGSYPPGGIGCFSLTWHCKHAGFAFVMFEGTLTITRAIQSLCPQSCTDFWTSNFARKASNAPPPLFSPCIIVPDPCFQFSHLVHCNMPLASNVNFSPRATKVLPQARAPLAETHITAERDLYFGICSAKGRMQGILPARWLNFFYCIHSNILMGLFVFFPHLVFHLSGFETPDSGVLKEGYFTCAQHGRTEYFLYVYNDSERALLATKCFSSIQCRILDVTVFWDGADRADSINGFKVIVLQITRSVSDQVLASGPLVIVPRLAARFF